MEAYSLEQSLEPLSISDAGSSTGSSPENQSAPTSKLNLHDNSPSFLWDQYLDLKTGEIMYSVDWGRGRKAKSGDWNTRATGKRKGGGRRYDGEGEEGSGTDSDAGSCSAQESCCNKGYLVAAAAGGAPEMIVEEGEVLVVTGCKQCLMYFMLPKVADECPQVQQPSAAPQLILNRHSTASLSLNLLVCRKKVARLPSYPLFLSRNHLL